MKEPRASYQIFVNTPTKVLCLQNIQPESTIIHLKSIAEMKTGIPVEQQELLLGGALLPDHSRINETQLRDKNVVRMVFKLKETKDLIEMVLRDDLAGILNIGVQLIDLAEANNDDERQRLLKWNQLASQRAFVAVCVACANGMLDLVVNLIKMSAFIANQVTLYGRSALHFAAARGSIGCVCVLLDNYIDPSIEDYDGKTAQDMASEHGHIHCKRRIWLYRWSITPKIRGKSNREENGDHVDRSMSENEARQGENVGGKIVRLPLLENNNSWQKQKGTLDLNSKDSSEFPDVSQQSSRAGQPQNNNKRTDWRLGTLPVEQSTNYRSATTDQIRPHIEDRTSKVRFLGKNMEPKAKTEQGTQTMEGETEGNEFATMLYLAQKYGYVISENPPLQNQEREIVKDSSVADGRRNQKFNRTLQIPMANSIDLQGISDEDNNEEGTDRSSKSRSHSKSSGDQESKKLGQFVAENEQDQGDSDAEMKQKDVKDSDQSTEEASKFASNSNNVETHASDELGYEKLQSVDGEKNEAPVPDSESSGVKERQSFEYRTLSRASLNGRGSINSVYGRIGVGFGGRRNDDARASFEQWLERKSREKKVNSNEETSGTLNQREKRKEINEQAFRKWLQLKKTRYRARSASVVRPSVGEGNNDKASRNGISFECWMTKKQKDKPRSLSLPVANTHTVVSRAYSSGITHEEWVQSKRKQDVELLQNTPRDGIRNDGKKRLNGMTYENWVETKQQLNQIEKVRQATQVMQIQYEKDIANQKKLKNPKIKTFEEWEISKKYEERLQRLKEKKERRNNDRKVKFEEDANLVYNMWLLNKHMYEMQIEEEQIEEARKMWEKKKKKGLVRVNTR